MQLNTRSKFFLVDNAYGYAQGLQPFINYNSNCNDVPLGATGTGRTTISTGTSPVVGYYDDTTKSCDISICLTAIPLAANTQDEQFKRSGTCIFIKRIFGHITIKRSSQADQKSGAVTPVRHTTAFPYVTAYLQQQPIPFEGSAVTHASGISVLVGAEPYPLTSTLFTDFVTYKYCEPNINHTTGAYGDGGIDIRATQGKQYMHRNPYTKSWDNIYSLKHFHHIPPKQRSNALIYGEVQATPEGDGTSTSGLWLGDCDIALSHVTRIPIDHHFNRTNGQIIYTEGDTTGFSPAVNPIWLKFHQDITGNMVTGTYTGKVMTGVTRCDSFGYNETFGLELWVEFEDAPTQLDT